MLHLPYPEKTYIFANEYFRSKPKGYLMRKLKIIIN